MARPHRPRSPRDEALRRLVGRGPAQTSPWARRVAAVVLGWLVLMTIWGFGRAWHGGLAPVELTVGLLAGTAATVVTWRRSGS